MAGDSRILEGQRATPSIEEFFNAEMETIAIFLWREGLEYNDDGNLVKVDTPFAMGFKTGIDQGGTNIAKEVK